MKKLLITLFLLIPSAAFAQTARVVQSCGTLPQAYTPGSTRDVVQDVNGNLCSLGGTGTIQGNVSNGADGVTPTSTNIPSASYNYLWNGTGWDRFPGNVANGSFMQGSVASGAADSGNPVKIGGVGSNTLPSPVTSGQRTNLWTGLNGQTIIGVGPGSAAGDTASNTTGFLTDANGTNRSLSIYAWGFNGTTWDRIRTDPTTIGSVWMAPVGRGSISTNQISVAATATVICAARTARNACTITNLGTVDVFCGTAGVTTTTGTLVVGIKGSSVTIPTVAAISCIVATGTQSVSILETF